jgi:hypothetical protein
MGNKLRWLLPVALAGSFIAAPSIFAKEQLAPAPVRNRVDRRQDRRALRHDGRRIDRRQARLHADARRFGPNSPQARADRRQLRRSERHFRYQARDLRQARGQAWRR